MALMQTSPFGLAPGPGALVQPVSPGLTPGPADAVDTQGISGAIARQLTRLPPQLPPRVSTLLRSCVLLEPSARPSVAEICDVLDGVDMDLLTKASCAPACPWFLEDTSDMHQFLQEMPCSCWPA